MKHSMLLLTMLLGLGGSAATTSIAKCRGPAFGLNPDHWQPSASDLKACSEFGHSRHGGL